MRLFIAMMKHCDGGEKKRKEKPFGEERAYSAYTSILLFIIEGS